VIGYLKGSVVEQSEETLILDVGGVGYELHCSSNTLHDLSAGQNQGQNQSQSVQVWVHTHVREDALMLFGFSSPIEKRMFNSLISVNGVGPKMAIKILSGSTLNHLAQMIDQGDVKGLSGLPKVGKKTAEQLILTLKGKLVLAEESAKSEPKTKAKVALTPAERLGPIRGDVLSALVNLGFRPQDVEKVVAGFPEDIDLQQGIRQGLRALSGQ
jgi:Holliday junction DNA helicase RuvA